MKKVKKIVSDRTVRRRLVEAGLPARRPRKKPFLTKKQQKARLIWAREHRHWTVEQWDKVTWSDESPFHLFCSNGLIWVRRRPWEVYEPICLKPTVKFGGGHINVWGIFSSQGVGPLYRINGIMDGKKYREILKNHMAPHVRQLGIKDFIFQQDNDPKHKSKIVQNYLNNQQFQLLSWPSQSPDLNPIENIWSYIKQKIRKRLTRASNFDDVYEFVKQEWEMLDKDYLTTLVHSMPRRIELVIKNKGGHIHY